VNLEEAVRTRHDEWTKEALSLWLRGLGIVQIDVRIAGTVRRGDVLFTETNSKSRRRKTLGMLGKLARGLVLFEQFHNPVTPWEVLTCIAKTVECTAQSIREARRAKRPLSTVTPTALCIVTPSASAELQADAELTLVDAEMPGIYRMAGILRTSIIVVDKLPQDASTVWLRLLGRDDTQIQAANELSKMHENRSLRDATMRLLVTWYQNLPKSVLTNFDRETTMNWQRMYEKWEQKTLKKGKAEGKAEGIAEGIFAVLEARGLSLTATQRKQVLQCKDVVQLDAWLRCASVTSDVKTLFALPAQPRRRTTSRAA
jgi:hypothetical protein